MKHTISIPNYTLKEEVVSAGSHALGVALAVSACALGVIRAALDMNRVGAIGIVSAAVYGATMIVLYCMSSIYHALPKGNAKRVFRVIDHCSVFLLIAGTYTPYALVSLRAANKALGWSVFGTIWGLTALGIVFNAIDLEKFEKVSGIINVVMGWMVVGTAYWLSPQLGPAGMRLLIWGGVIYSIGAVLYSLGHKVPYAHSIFHFFVLGGSVLHFLSIYLTVL